MFHNLKKSFSALFYVAQHVNYIPLMAIAVIASTLFESITVYVFSELIALANNNPKTYAFHSVFPNTDILFILSLSIALSYIIVIFLKMYWLRKASSIGYDLSNNIIKGINNSYFTAQLHIKHEEVLNALIPEIQRLSSHVIFRVIQLVASIILILFISALLYILIGQLFFLVLLIFVPYLITLGIFSNSLLIINSEIKDNQSKRVTSLNDYINHTRLLHFNRLGEYNIAQFHDANISIGTKIGLSNVISQIPKYVVEIALAIILVIYITSKGYTSFVGHVSAESLGLLFIGLFKIIPAVQEIYRSMTSISSNISSLDTVRDLHIKVLQESNIYGFGKTGKKFTHIDAIEGKDISLGTKINIKCPDFFLSKGSALLLQGSSGAGKTTLLDCLVGLIEPDKGYISVNEIPVSEHNVCSYRENVSYCPQKNYLNHDYLFYLNNDSHLKRKEALDLFKQFNIEKHYEIFSDSTRAILVKNLSGGEQRKIGIIRTMISNKSIMVFDEPLNDLDDESVNTFIDILNLMKNEGKIIFMVSHDNRLSRVADETVTISNG